MVDAHKMLTSALNTAHLYLTQTSITKPENTPLLKYSKSDNEHNECCQTIGTSFIREGEYSVSPNENVSSVQEIYGGAFILTSDVLVGQTETISIMLFNLALIHHQMAIRQNRMYKLAKALQIYQKAVKLAQESNWDRLQIMLAAAYVNMIQILMMVGVPETIKEASHVLMHLNGNVNRFLHSPLRTSISPKDLEFFAVERFFVQTSMLSYRCASAA